MAGFFAAGALQSKSARKLVSEATENVQISKLIDPEELLPVKNLVDEIDIKDKSMTSGPIEVVKTKFGKSFFRQ